jgi:O-antigen/teichoic acid export membrane protein
MFDKLKRLGAETAIYGVSTIVGRFLTFLLVPFYTNVLPSTSDYGIVATVYAYIAFLNVIYGCGMESAFFRYASALEIGDAKQNFCTPFLSIFLTSLIFSSFIQLFSGPVAGLIGIGTGYASLVRYAAWILFFDALCLIPFASLRLQNRAKLFATIKILNIISNIILNVVLLLKFRLGVEGIFISGFASSGLTLFLLLPSIRKQFQLRFHRDLFRHLLRFGLPLIPAALSGIAVQVIDRPILKALTNDSVVGIYQANYRLGIFMMLIVSMFDYAWRPFFLTTAKEANAKEIFSRVMTYFVVGASFAFLLFSFFIGDIVRIHVLGHYFIKPEYWSGLSIVPVVLCAYIFTGMNTVLVAGVHIEKKTHILAYTTGLGAIVNVVCNYLLIPHFGMLGAAYATLFSYLVMAGSLYVIVQRFYFVPYEFGRIVTIAIVTALLFFLFSRVGFGGLALSSFIIKVLLLLAFPILLFLSRFFDSRELAALRRLFRLA